MADGKKYQVMDLVATGGTAVLYRAVQTSLDRVVAVKKLHHHLTTDENFTRRFILEAKAAAALDHENIVKIIDFGVEDGTYMMVMEFIEGESLKDIIEKWRQIPANLALVLVHQICMGLEHAHAKGIVHRDVKPGNIMLTRSGKVKITDFGLAKLAQAETQHTAANSILGTPLYMSPEQAFGESVDQRSDLFSLGTVLYECLTGRQPFQGESYMGVIQNIIHQNAPHPSKLGVELPEGVAPIIAKAMNKNRDARFQSAREFRLAIEKHLGLDGLKNATEGLKSLLSTDGATMVLPQTERAKRKSRRLRATLSIAFTVAAMSAIVATTYLVDPETIRGLADGVVALVPAKGFGGPAPSDELTAAGLSSGLDPLSDPAASDHPTGSAADTAASPADTVLALDTADPPASAGTAADTSRSTGTAFPDTASTAVDPIISRDAAPRGPETAPTEGETTPAVAAVEKVRPGWLSVTSEPPAELYIDGRYTGDTPKVRIPLTGGSHTIECVTAKHDAYRETIHITAGEISSRRVVLTKLVGRVSLSTIEGAEVLIDGVLAGITPLDAPIELEAGRHQITVKKAGFHVWNNGVTIEAKQLLPLKITLSPIY
jgi:tRNA A-37 threonylcarbamoyl transferase component Bud32